MKKSKKKLVGLSLAACALSLTGAMLCISSPKTVSAATSYGLTMSKGAAVRLKADDDATPVNGLRFDAQMTKAGYTALQDSGGSEIVLSSTATANEVSKTVEWVLKSATLEEEEPSFDSKDIAKFYHTLTFESLSGEKLKQANAFNFEASFKLEVDGETVWESETETRSMRQVAYIEYTTEGMEGYRENTLLNYFSVGEDNEKVYSVGEADESTVSSVVQTTAYAEVDGMFVDVSNTAMKDLYAQNAEYVVVFNENNVASKTPIKWPDAMISTAKKMEEVLTDNETEVGEYYVLSNNIYLPTLEDFENDNVQFNGILDGNGYTVYAPQRAYGLFGNIAESAVVKNVKLVIDITTAEGLKLSQNQTFGLGIKAFGTFENLHVKMIGDATKIKDYGFALFSYGKESSTFRNVVLDYADVMPALTAWEGDRHYNSLFGLSQKYNGKADNIHIVSTTTNWMSNDFTSGDYKLETVKDFPKVKLYANTAEILVEDLPSKYWESTGTNLVWKTDKVLETKNQVVWSANTKVGYVVDDVLREGEEVVSVKDVVSDIVYYENGNWTDANVLPKDRGEEAPVIFYKTVEILGDKGTKVTALMSACNRAIATEDDLDFIAPNTTLAGSYVMVDNVSVSEWKHGTLGDKSSATETTCNTNFNGTFDGNGYTLAFPQRGFGLFGNIGATAVVKNVRFDIGVRKEIEGCTYPVDMSLYRGGLLGTKMYGAFENIYMQARILTNAEVNTNGIALVAQIFAGASMKNVVVDFGDILSKIGTKLSSYGYKGYLSGANNPEAGTSFENVYAIGTNNTRFLQDRGSKHGYTATLIAENETKGADTDFVVAGVRRYNSVEEIKNDTATGKKLDGFNTLYWKVDSGAPVWIGKE